MKDFVKILVSLCFLFSGLQQGSCVHALGVFYQVAMPEELSEFQEECSEKIDTIIREELSKLIKKKHVSYPCPQVQIKNDAHITVLYDKTVAPKYDQQAFLMLQMMQASGRGFLPTAQVTLTSTLDLYGSYGEFVVIQVNPYLTPLCKVHHEVKSALRWMQDYTLTESYTSRGLVDSLYQLCRWIKSFFVPIQNKYAIFDERSWEHYSYNPHITLLTLPRKEIFSIASWNKADPIEIWELIKKRVKEEVLTTEKMIPEDISVELLTLRVTGRKWEFLGDLPCTKNESNDAVVATNAV